MNSNIEKKKLQTEFEKLKPRSNENPNAYYDQFNTLTSELRKMFQAYVTDDMVHRALLKYLPDVAKNNFLQLKATDPYRRDDSMTCATR